MSGPGPGRPGLGLAVGVGLALAFGCTSPSPSTNPSPAPVRAQPGQALSRAQSNWVEKTLSRLTLREKVGQMTMVWLLGDYTSVDDSTFQQVRGWVERDHVGGIAMSLGTPIEVAAKLNDLQRRSAIPML